MKKIYILYTLILLIVSIFVGRLYYLQIATDRYKLNAINTSIKQEIIHPNRGDILDRNGKLLVSNSYIYELNIIPALVNEEFDTLGFCKLSGIEKEDFKLKLTQIINQKDFKKILPYPLVKSIPREDYARIQEQLYLYPAISIVKRPERKYLVHSAGNILGYINEASPAYIKRDSTYYEPGDLVGIAGVERSYEKELRGVKGVKNYIADRLMKPVGPYKNGEYDRAAQSGKTITLTIDYELQEYAESLLQGKRGAVVAIDPKNGEILVLASAPTIDPNAFLNSIERNQIIRDSINKPNYDRATQGTYPPGSPFKLVTGLAALQMQVNNDSTTYTCKHGYRQGRLKIGCHCGQYYRPIGLELAIAKSCNNYFSSAYRDIIKKYPNNPAKSINEWAAIMNSFGLGVYLNNDLAVGSAGLIPTERLYNNRFGENNWGPLNAIYNGMGQGDISSTPLQMANFTAAIANRGFYYTPHIVKEIDGKPNPDERFTKPKKTLVDKKYYEPVFEGMKKVFTIGTARRFRTKLFEQAGKTGTSQNSQGQDHSLFTLIAPADDPQIVIAVVVENGHYGATWAGPISSLVAEKYIKGEVTRKSLENKMLRGNLENEYKKQWINYLKRKGWYVEPEKPDTLENIPNT